MAGDHLSTGDFAERSKRALFKLMQVFDASRRRYFSGEGKRIFHRRDEPRSGAPDNSDETGAIPGEIRELIASRGDAAVSGSQIVAVGRIMQKARESFGTDEKARRWLLRPTSALSGMSPLDVSFAGESGVRRVVDLLDRIDHGLSV